MASSKVAGRNVMKPSSFKALAGPRDVGSDGDKIALLEPDRGLAVDFQAGGWPKAAQQGGK